MHFVFYYVSGPTTQIPIECLKTLKLTINKNTFWYVMHKLKRTLIVPQVTMTEPTLYPSFTMCPEYSDSNNPLSSNEWEYEKMRPMNEEV
jgi:hypothetical protein